MERLYFIVAYGEEKQHAANLHAGLMMLGPDFNASICHLCNGEAQFEQTYTAGCGGGYYKSMGPCYRCERMGLLQYDKPASPSVVAQVVHAGEIFLGVKS
jgi:hypothetical protein